VPPKTFLQCVLLFAPSSSSLRYEASPTLYLPFWFSPLFLLFILFVALSFVSLGGFTEMPFVDNIRPIFSFFPRQKYQFAWRFQGTTPGYSLIFFGFVFPRPLRRVVMPPTGILAPSQFGIPSVFPQADASRSLAFVPVHNLDPPFPKIQP